MELRDCQPDDAEDISALAGQIWRVVYPGMISIEQIEYMLGWMYSPEKIREDLRRGVSYCFIETEDEKTAGYAAFGPDSEADGVWLHKLYIAPEFQRRGLATAAISEIYDRLGNGNQIWLRVNRGNEGAIATYLKNGFEVVEEKCSDIGGGFVMDDFIMQKSF